MRDDRRDPEPRRWREDTPFSVELLARRMEAYENRLLGAIERFDKRIADAVRDLRADIKRFHDDIDKRVDELEEWHLMDTAITGERIAQRALGDRRWVRVSIAVGVLGGIVGVLGGLHVI